MFAFGRVERALECFAMLLHEHLGDGILVVVSVHQELTEIVSLSDQPDCKINFVN